ncbi:Arylsulfatase [Anaerohalosphaera lusitana]|uniref:Arylsulfatase n=2 Tax=Anaerohalosphaera lusitana TaxID=1936003 RepID=A0A1U9NJJ3_9BACT|nr:Arylsulfatase [Anaerohalosphaera lusitana]
MILRNIFSNIFLASAVLIIMVSGCTAQNQSPNIVLIISDDQAWTDYGFMGHPVIQTPNLDRLSEEGVLFPRGYVPTPLCRPSLMTMATGLYPHQHGVTGNDPSPKRYTGDAAREANLKLENFIDNYVTIPEALAERGYLSFQSGKWWEGDYQNGGFTHGMTTQGRHGGPGLKIGRQGMDPLYEFVDYAVEQEKPFFVWYAPFLPHTPHNPPQRLLDKYTTEGRDPALAKYYAMCDWFDETCGQVVDYIEQKKIRENTVFVYVCDNGWIQRTADTEVPHGYRQRFAPRSKQTTYEGGIRTPIFFNCPDHFSASKRSEMVSSIDLYPTILAIAGSETPDDRPGLNLLPAVEGGKAIKRDTIFGEGFSHDIADLDNPEKSLLTRWCIEGRWKLILSYDGENERYKAVHKYPGPVQLFDVISDPHETQNLADEYPEVVARLKAKIKAWWPVKEATLISKD